MFKNQTNQPLIQTVHCNCSYSLSLHFPQGHLQITQLAALVSAGTVAPADPARVSFSCQGALMARRCHSLSATVLQLTWTAAALASSPGPAAPQPFPGSQPGWMPTSPWPQLGCSPSTVFWFLSPSHPTQQQGQKQQKGKQKMAGLRPPCLIHHPCQTQEQNLCSGTKLESKERRALYSLTFLHSGYSDS